jgi:hypothetical protein
VRRWRWPGYPAQDAPDASERPPSSLTPSFSRQTKGEVGFAGNTGSGATSGPNGVVAIPYLNQLYVGDGDSTVKVVDLTAKAIIASIHTGGSFRADELAYDPVDHIVMIGNPDDSPPYLTFISTDTQTVLGTIFYPLYNTRRGWSSPCGTAKSGGF